KEMTDDSSLLRDISPDLNNEANAALKKGNEAFQAKNYDLAGAEFLKSFYLYDAVGNNNNLLLYYAGIALLQTDNKAKSAEILQSLVDQGFTGVQTNYYAVEKDSGKEVAFATKQDMDTQVKLGLASEPRVETTESLEE